MVPGTENTACLLAQGPAHLLLLWALLPHADTHTLVLAVNPAQGRNVAHTFGRAGWKQPGYPAKGKWKWSLTLRDQTLVSKRGAGDVVGWQV